MTNALGLVCMDSSRRALRNRKQQCTRAYEAYQRKQDDLERHIFALQDRNEVLFYGSYTGTSRR